MADRKIKAPKVVRDLDEIDEAAAAEGFAMNRIRACYFTDKKPLGRRLVRQGQKDSRGVAIVRKNRIRNLEIDQKRIEEQYIIGRE